MSPGYRLMVYKLDKRTKTGERFVGSYEYAGYSHKAILNEISALKQNLYRTADGWRLDFERL